MFSRRAKKLLSMEEKEKLLIMLPMLPPSVLTVTTPNIAIMQDVHNFVEIAFLFTNTVSKNGTKIVVSCTKMAARIAVVSWIPDIWTVDPRKSQSPSSIPAVHSKLNPLVKSGSAATTKLSALRTSFLGFFDQVEKYLTAVRALADTKYDKRLKISGGGAITSAAE